MEQNEVSYLVNRHVGSLGIALSEDQTELFVRFLHHLQIWNKKANLTSITGDEEIVIKHFVDSLAVLKAKNIKLGAHILDVGTGAGFPGIPLKIVRPDLSMTLVEPVQKKVSFLHFIVGSLELKGVKVFCGTFSQFVSESTQSLTYDYVTIRALRHDVILNHPLPMLSSSAKCILFQSKPLSRTDIGAEWSIESEFPFSLPNSLGSRVISFLARTSLFHVEHMKETM